ncbi:hypothetical protein PW5551_08500 [Petrotoga sp. 9PW.55.5.1]|uniref:class II fructose-bisphosphate aldolase n=1 Tax=Petrotoga sp. 9PW.55.5.1 TaxID=1308979 RepID=UPI000DC4B36F|nr:class II fructose-bisphosphate aldolase [Petrotoga sp. 9PW.55.5.1]RAO98639.1 hypothetical protein PW5551_08500 [Petrotoga sp. 9PW.55.5.1]
MAIVNLREVLTDANKRNYAVGCFNTINYESVRGVLEAAEETRSPVIIGIAESQLVDVDLFSIMNIMTYEAKRFSIPIVIHLDHGTTFETIRRAIELGCSSVMYDGSSLPLEENIKNTKKIVEYAASLNVFVEAEVGEMGSETKEISLERAEETDLLLALEFVKHVTVDALAVSFGTRHGITSETPKLNIKLLEEIHKKLNIPLVMHGGSGLRQEDYKCVIKNGIRKINYFSYGYLEVANKIRNLINKSPSILYDKISYFSKEAFKEVYKEVMKMFECAGKA